MSNIETLPELLTPTGHSAYCGLCWEPVFRFWVDKCHAPDYTRCPIGDFTAQTCPNPTGAARQKADIQRAKAAGLWPEEPEARAFLDSLDQSKGQSDR